MSDEEQSDVDVGFPMDEDVASPVSRDSVDARNGKAPAKKDDAVAAGEDKDDNEDEDEDEDDEDDDEEDVYVSRDAADSARMTGEGGSGFFLLTPVTAASSSRRSRSTWSTTT